MHTRTQKNCDSNNFWKAQRSTKRMFWKDLDHSHKEGESGPLISVNVESYKSQAVVSSKGDFFWIFGC